MRHGGSLPDFIGHGNTDPEGLHLVSRRSGGALILRRGGGTTATVWFNITVAEMYTSLRTKRDGHRGPGLRSPRQPTLAPVVAWREAVMTSMYDPADEAEAAEQVLVGLGAPFRRIPKTAHTYGTDYLH